MFPPALNDAAVRTLVSVVGGYTLEALRDGEQRAQRKQQCADRLRMNDRCQVQHAEEEILASLDSGIDALEEAIQTSDNETKVARLDEAEELLQVCALLDVRGTTAGVANSYLSAWAHLNLAFVWKLRCNDRNAANHMLEMFLIDPLLSRVDLTPGLWEHLFLPYLSSIVNWYTKQRQSIVMSGVPGNTYEEYEICTSLSDSRDLQTISVHNLTFDRTPQLQALENMYQESLDENTRQYARYYKDWLSYVYDSANVRIEPRMPIAEAPMTRAMATHNSEFLSRFEHALPPITRVQEPAVAVGSRPSPLGLKNSTSTSSERDTSSRLEIPEAEEKVAEAYALPGHPGSTKPGLRTSSSFRKYVTQEPSNVTNSQQQLVQPSQARGGRLRSLVRSSSWSRCNTKSSLFGAVYAHDQPQAQTESRQESQISKRLGGLSSFVSAGSNSTSESSSPGLKKSDKEILEETPPTDSQGAPLGFDPKAKAPAGARALGRSSSFENYTIPSAGHAAAHSKLWRNSSSGKMNPGMLRRTESGRYQNHGTSFHNPAGCVSDVLHTKTANTPMTSTSSAFESTFFSHANCCDQSSHSGAQTAVRIQPRYATASGSENLEMMRGRSRVPGPHEDEATASPCFSRAMPRSTTLPESSSSRNDHHYGQRRMPNGVCTRQLHRSSSTSRSVAEANRATHVTRPPKDFMCPITKHLFNDPVTLETGQTYERKAIQEWLDQGSTTCPISRQLLRISTLPRTNYVLKRVVDSWKAEHPKLVLEFGSTSEPPLFMASGLMNNFGEEFYPIKTKPSTGMIELGERGSEPNSPCSVSSVSSTERSDRQTCHLSRRQLSVNAEMTSQFGTVSIDELITDLKPAITCLSRSEHLLECETVVLEMARTWQEARGDPKMVTLLSKAGVIEGLLEIISNSSSLEPLRATLYLLSGLTAKDEFTRQILVHADPEMECLKGLLRSKKGLDLAVVVLYQLKLPIKEFTSPDFLPLLIEVIKQSDENRNGVQEIPLMMRPKSAAVIMLEEIANSGDESTFLLTSQALLALQAVPALISSLESRNVEERTSAVSLLFRCMQTDGGSRNVISQFCNLAPVIELLQTGNIRAKTVTISFLGDLVRLNRRARCNEILQAVKTEGLMNSKHVLLVHLRRAPVEKRSVAAGLLLQLDLLEEPLKTSMYREEAIESLLECLTRLNDAVSQKEAANTLISLGGRFSSTGKSLMEPSLLKTAGLEKRFLSLINDEPYSNEQDTKTSNEDEERVAKVWERRVAGALLDHDAGALIEALGQAIQSENPEVSKPLMTVAIWLTHLLPALPATGVRELARTCLLDHFVRVLQTSKELPQRVLAALALHTFISDQDDIKDLLRYAKDVCGPLRELKKSTWVARDILRAFVTHASPTASKLWQHVELGQFDTSSNGEVQALCRARTLMFSGHSDGTIKVWNAQKTLPVLVQEIKEHSKSVTSLAVSQNSDRLYSGSLDKSIRVWSVGTDDIHSLHTFDLRDAVMGLVVNGPMACIIPQGGGIKQVQYEEVPTKALNLNKHVQSLAIHEGKIYCGCTDNSIQELEPISGATETIQHGVRTLLGKRAIYAVHVSKGRLIAAGSPVDGAAAKIWKLSDLSLIGTLCTTAEVRSMAVSEDYIYLGSSAGLIEVWLRERMVKVTTLNAESKVTALLLDGDTIYSGCKDGKIRAWAMI